MVLIDETELEVLKKELIWYKELLEGCRQGIEDTLYECSFYACNSEAQIQRIKSDLRATLSDLTRAKLVHKTVDVSSICKVVKTDCPSCCKDGGCCNGGN